MMALRQLLGVLCLAVHLQISSVGVYGAIDHLRGETDLKIDSWSH